LRAIPQASLLVERQSDIFAANEKDLAASAICLAIIFTTLRFSFVSFRFVSFRFVSFRFVLFT
jgi:hypothetical protein